MKAYAYDNLPGDGRLAHDDSGRAPPIPLPLLAATLNIHAQHLPLLADVDAIARAEHYTQRDEITISAAALGGADQYEAKRAVFFAEHLHDDDEIRYVLAGAGFFDVRDRADAWVRVRVERGDLLRLPAGIYHRFSPDEGDMRASESEKTKRVV
ncbi:MAG: 1,2-dihydroxy-3-keto-5-methylthiopentene dioxygenase [Phylliscum demangeonii]|nr:MAG: 1,2-dihydroxy-3-keto-5-methylthiopentene dioxygenase [Phylliscum demangeonii]